MDYVAHVTYVEQYYQKWLPGYKNRRCRAKGRFLAEDSKGL